MNLNGYARSKKELTINRRLPLSHNRSSHLTHVISLIPFLGGVSIDVLVVSVSRPGLSQAYALHSRSRALSALCWETDEPAWALLHIGQLI